MTYLYKTKKSATNSHTLILDFHGSTKEVVQKFDNSLTGWVDMATKGEYPWVISVDIICGGGNQILSEAAKGGSRATVKLPIGQRITRCEAVLDAASPKIIDSCTHNSFISSRFIQA